MLLIERIPAASSFARNQSGLGRLDVFDPARGIKRALVGSADLHCLAEHAGLSALCASRSGFFVSAAISRASPSG